MRKVFNLLLVISILYFQGCGKGENKNTKVEIKQDSSITTPINPQGQLKFIDFTMLTNNVSKGKPFRFFIRWQVAEPFSADKGIGYYISNDNNFKWPPLVYLDVKKNYTDSRNFSEYNIGEIIQDTIEIEVPAKATPGAYQISSLIFPENNTKILGLDRSKLLPNQYFLKEFNIK
jgi:hypothetical protein